MQTLLLGHVPNTGQAYEAGHMGSRTQIGVQIGGSGIEGVLAASKVIAWPCEGCYLCYLAAACSMTVAIKVLNCL